eukprot:m.46155 g.46155  ORF g.46155 m.46155 type:complete len:60 (-) comp8725_c0_seq1:564-743(-)
MDQSGLQLGCDAMLRPEIVEAGDRLASNALARELGAHTQSIGLDRVKRPDDAVPVSLCK